VVGGEVVGRGEAAVEGALIEGLHEDGADVDLLVTKDPFDLRIRTHRWVDKVRTQWILHRPSRRHGPMMGSKR